MKLGEMDLQSAAKEAAGNWQDFTCFCWHRLSDIDDPENWAIIYTHHRDSGLLDLSNAEVISEALQPFAKGDNPHVVFESHNHWAVGHIDGFSVRVFRRGHITKAFRKYHELAQKHADYPVLDENDWSLREYEATLENIPDAAWRLKNDYELPEGWEESVYHWFSEHDCSAIENCDDEGSYPTEEQLRAAFEALDYKQLEFA